ncbi:hypothetical protein X742_20955 [Mesorhizobium sp. LNHC232B00]|nr:hypothetical protein X742_20955 [Mesorhizobium sp. LNHC232B00]
MDRVRVDRHILDTGFSEKGGDSLDFGQADLGMGIGEDGRARYVVNPDMLVVDPAGAQVPSSESQIVIRGRATEPSPAVTTWPSGAPIGENSTSLGTSAQSQALQANGSIIAAKRVRNRCGTQYDGERRTDPHIRFDWWQG